MEDVVASPRAARRARLRSFSCVLPISAAGPPPPRSRRRPPPARRPALPIVFANVSAAIEALAPVPLPHCRRCGGQLREAEARWGTGLCNGCYPHVRKDCRLCSARIPHRQLRWGSDLCSTCFHACERHCRMCRSEIALQDLDFRIGLCSTCYSSCEKKCKMCRSGLELGQLWWGTGLCDTCYSTWHKVCKVCNNKPQGWQKHWSTGLCDACYDACALTCRSCGRAEVALGAPHWRRGLCGGCADEGHDAGGFRKTAQHADAAAHTPASPNLERSRSLPWDVGTGSSEAAQRKDVSLDARGWRVVEAWRIEEVQARKKFAPIDGIASPPLRQVTTPSEAVDAPEAIASEKSFVGCALCGGCAPPEGRHWATGLCDRCHEDNEKECLSCKTMLPFGQRHWDIGLCATCHASCVLTCKNCQRNLSRKEYVWGFQLCDSCFDGCDRACSSCGKLLDLRQLHWGTGVCDTCYETSHSATGLARGVWAAIGAQFVFYMAPEMLRPGLFLRIQLAGYEPDAPQVYARVQTFASFVSMAAPVLMAWFAERQGKRLAYCVACLAGMLAAMAFVAEPPALVFALAWACITMPPPAMRGIRQAFFANTVPLEELNRAGQLASSVGVLGGFVGPSLCGGAQLGASLFDEESLDVFVACAAIACAAFAACMVALWLFLPPGEDCEVESVDATDPGSPAATPTERRRQSSPCSSCGSPTADLRTEGGAASLCGGCFDNFSSTRRSFRNYSRQVLICFSLVACLLELSLNAGVIAAFQPVIVQHFGWTSSEIACVSSAGALLSIAISFLVAHLRLPERFQALGAACCYLLSVLTFSTPPLSQGRLIAGVMLGISAQIMLYAPLEAIFAQLIGRTRVTTELATLLSLAPAVGTALGTLLAPACVAAAGQWAGTAVALPALAAVLGMSVELTLGCCALGSPPELRRSLMEAEAP